jgi:Fe-S cluster biogenesis protein NfuA
MELTEDELNQYAYLKRQHYLATHMELTEENVIRVLQDLMPYIEADGGWLEFVEIEHETNFVKVRLGGACSTCAMSAMTLKQGIEKKVMSEIPECYGVIQVL